MTVDQKQKREYDWDVLTDETLRASLGPDAEGLRLCVFPSCDSTNLQARKLAVEGEMRPTLLVAEEQTAGRGRLGRSFHSPFGSGLYLSLLFPLREELAGVVSLTCAASVGVMRAIRSTTGAQTEIKWVNDLLLGGKKVCGILTEAFTVGSVTHVVIGVGVNLRPIELPEELRPIASSLDDETVTRSALAAEIARELLAIARRPSNGGWLDEYRRHACVTGRRVRWTEQGREQVGRVTGIDSDGALLLQGEDGIPHRLQSGEITLRPSEGESF